MASPVRQAGDEPQLPDFDIIARCHQSLATEHQSLAIELVKCRNVPAFDQGAEILNAIRGMREEMNGMREEMNEKIDGINEKIDRFDGRFKAMYVALPSFLP
jgi:hypothetical protein